MKSRTWANALLFGWFTCWTSFCLAAAADPNDLLGYDWPSAGKAALAGLLGGVLQTILQLARRGALVIDVLKQARQDLVYALGGGVVLYVIVQGLSSMGWVNVPRDMRILIFAGVGYSRGAWMAWVSSSANLAAERAQRMIRDKSTPADTLPSAVVPLEENPK